MFSNLLIEYCSPTLAGIKTGSLFNFPFNSHIELLYTLELWNKNLNLKGVKITPLKIMKDNASIYVYRENQLTKDLRKNGVPEFLNKYGYDISNIPLCIDILRSRISKSKSFPHEIGLFLSYPLGDVIGFIKNNGKNSIYTGFWKVYCNKNEAIKVFDKYNKCKKIYQKLYTCGKPIIQLTTSISKV